MTVPMVRRDRRWIWYLVAVAVVWAAIAFGSDFVGLFAGSHHAPFDLRSVGARCGDDHDWTCGSVAVPLDRSASSSATIRVHFRVLPRLITQNASAGTMVIVAGGPGQASMPQYQWAQSAMRAFRADRDLLLVDNRGTGASAAIDCPMLQTQQPYASADAVAECRGLLGARADDYGTIAATDDLDQVLTAIHATHVDLYAESYGTYFAQVFALRHPQRLQRMVLDGAYPLAVDPWRRDAIPAALADLRAVCKADARCHASGDPVAALARVLPSLRDQKLTGQTSDAFGRFVDVEGSVADLAFVLDEAGRDGSAYRELPAALAAAIRTSNPDPVPLLRLIAERRRPILGPSREPTTRASKLSIGLLVAETCADYPQPFRLADPPSSQIKELVNARREAVAAIGNTVAPFLAAEVVSPETTCVGWPPPNNPPPTSHPPLPKVPTLVLEGSLDTVTPPTGAQLVAREFPKGRYLEIPNTGHVTALSDNTHCAAGIAATFLTSGTTDTSCIARIPAPAIVDAFPTRLAQEPPAVSVLAQPDARTSTADLRAIAVARDAICDVVWRWARVGILSGYGLRGGTFNANGPFDQNIIDVQLHDIQWTTDTKTSGDLRISPQANALTGAITLTTPTQTIDLNIQTNLYGATVMTITGNISGHNIDALVDAPINL